MKRILGCVLLALAPAAAGAATTTTPLQLTVTVVPAELGWPSSRNTRAPDRGA